MRAGSMEQTYIAVAKIKKDPMACNLRLLELPKVASSKDKHDRLVRDDKTRVRSPVPPLRSRSIFAPH